MKTREEFVLLVDQYRKEVRRRGLVMLPVMVLAIIVYIMIAALMGRYFGNHSRLIGIWIILFFVVILSLNFYQGKSQQSLARKFELVCPSCSRVMRADKLNLAIATHNCPYCGSPIFS